MGLVSTEEAILSFVRKVKDDPDSSQLFRDAFHELEVLLDPSVAEDEQAAEVPAEPAAPADPEPAEPAEPVQDETPQDG